MKNKDGFLVPDGYFDSLESRIEAQIALADYLPERESSGFKVPDHYFESLETRILAQTVQVVAAPKQIRLWHRDWVKYASAACFVLLTATGLFFNHQQTLQNNRYAEISNESLLYDIDENTIMEHLQEEQTATRTVSDAAMEEYLINHYSANELTNNL